MKATRRVLVDLLLRSLVCSHRSLICLLHTAHGRAISVFKLNASISFNFSPLCNLRIERTKAWMPEGAMMNDRRQSRKLDFISGENITRLFHGGLDKPVIGTFILGHSLFCSGICSLVCSLVCSLRSIVYFLCTASFARLL